MEKQLAPISPTILEAVTASVMAPTATTHEDPLKETSLPPKRGSIRPRRDAQRRDSAGRSAAAMGLGGPGGRELHGTEHAEYRMLPFPPAKREGFTFPKQFTLPG